MKIQIFKSFNDLSETAWNSLTANTFPFSKWAFLTGLESHRCIGSRTGWAPRIVTAWSENNAITTLLGAIILFEKTNSYGEYIFDFAWAQAHESYGFEYYPKLVSAIPFTPATGTKLLVHAGLAAKEVEEVQSVLIAAASQFYTESELSSLHALFIPEQQQAAYEAAGFFIRHSYQFHWRNQNYKTFEDFLSNLRSKRRREVLRERAQVQTSKVRIQRLTGAELQPQHAEWMYQFYHDTVSKMGGFDYLTFGFFQHVFATMKEQILFVLATTAAGEPVAGALNFFDSTTLFGRHWGCLEEYKALHFEVCYYQGIEFAIEKGFSLFEAGAQGEHKFQRGFLPTLTYSAHKIKEPRLDPAIQDFVQREKLQLEALFDEYNEHSPFQRTP